ncbi:DUF427-domain-containing protein [Athelia psychrophila]|uniref:DUF427-domain-containing protein n=1 Tax=Athelia psychrophila TaxID=1759441 RepID=A0A166QL91_9AGAM|nr:DUF427-domain-containing protein [Fibularhizoctonia sp. CBS 109695]
MPSHFTNANTRIEPARPRIRVLFGGKFVIDTNRAKLVWEHPRYPYYYFPAADLPATYLRPAGGPHVPDSERSIFDLVVEDLVLGDRVAPAAVTKFASGSVKDLVKIEWAAADAWFEEDEQVWVHPKDPYKRVDVWQSSKHIVVKVDDVEVANTYQPRLLFKTGVRTRTYIPKPDCRLDLFQPSELTTECPYKASSLLSTGVANYYSIHLPNGDELAKDAVWWYHSPLPECATIQGYVVFYDEKVDVWVDGVKQPQ